MCIRDRSCTSSDEDTAKYLAQSLAGQGVDPEHCPAYAAPLTTGPGFAVDGIAFLGQVSAICHAAARTGILHVCHLPTRGAYAYEARGADAETQVRTIICHEAIPRSDPQTNDIDEDDLFFNCHTETAETLVAVFDKETKTCAKAA